MLSPSIEQVGLRHARSVWYDISPLCYLVAGAVRYNQGMRADAANLCVQAGLSYLSDVAYLGRASCWHPADRYMALFTAAFHFATLRSRRAWVLNLATFAVGWHFLCLSQKHYLASDERFARAHTVWHLSSIVMALASR